MTPPSIQPLIHRHLDGTATPEEASRLALALLEDPAAARAFAEVTRLEAGLRSCFQAEAVGRRLAEIVHFESTQRRGHARAGWAAAAATLVMAGLSLAWWRPWARLASPPALANIPAMAPKKRVDTPSPPPSLRRPGALSAAARAVKQLASRYWLPDAIEFANTPLAQAAALLQQRATTVNHRQNGTIAQFAIDLPEECAGRPVTAARAELPLGAWLELLSAQAGCELRYTETGVAFDPVEQPDSLETRQFPLPTIADAQAPAEAPARLFSYARPWDEEPNFRSAPPHGTTLASAWGIALPASTRAVVKDGRTLEIRHTRRELRRLEGLLAVATADAGRPMVTFRAKEVPLPAPAPAPMVAQLGQTPTIDDFIVDLNLSPDVVEFEGFLNYQPVGTFGENAEGVRAGLALTESGIEQPVFATRILGSRSGNRVVGNDEAGALLTQPWLGRLFRATRIVRSDSSGARSVDPSAADTVSSRPRVEEEKVLLEHTVQETASPDPWSQSGQATVPLGASAWLATGAVESVVTGPDLLTVGFSLLDLQAPPPLQATARLEGELVKLTGSYTPPGGGGAPTDFQAYVGEGQSFILQTEDVPAASLGQVQGDRSFILQTEGEPAAPGGMVDSGLLFGRDSPQWEESVNGRVHEAAITWNWQDAPDGKEGAGGTALPATVRGVVISPVLEWPSVVSQ